jgi:hypothetical protein
MINKLGDTITILFEVQEAAVSRWNSATSINVEKCLWIDQRLNI